MATTVSTRGKMQIQAKTCSRGAGRIPKSTVLRPGRFRDSTRFARGGRLLRLIINRQHFRSPLQRPIAMRPNAERIQSIRLDSRYRSAQLKKRNMLYNTAGIYYLQETDEADLPFKRRITGTNKRVRIHLRPNWPAKSFLMQ